MLLPSSLSWGDLSQRKESDLLCTTTMHAEVMMQTFPFSSYFQHQTQSTRQLNTLNKIFTTWKLHNSKLQLKTMQSFAMDTMEFQLKSEIQQVVWLEPQKDTRSTSQLSESSRMLKIMLITHTEAKAIEPLLGQHDHWQPTLRSVTTGGLDSHRIAVTK